MTLIIDETPVTFTLENEKTIDEVVQAINGHVKQYYSYVKSIEIDGEHYSTDTQAAPALDAIDTLQVYTAHIHELYLAKLELLHEVLHECIQNNDGNTLTRLGIDVEEIQSIAITVLPQEDTDAICAELTKSGNSQIQDSLLKKIEYRIQCLRDPLTSCKKTLKILTQVFEQMQDNPTQLQTGDTQPVIAHLITFSELLQDIIRSYLLCTHRFLSLPAIDFAPLQNQLNELKQTLTEETLDTVMLADLIEYELIPIGREWIEKTTKNLTAIDSAS